MERNKQAVCESEGGRRRREANHQSKHKDAERLRWETRSRRDVEMTKRIKSRVKVQREDEIKSAIGTFRTDIRVNRGSKEPQMEAGQNQDVISRKSNKDDRTVAWKAWGRERHDTRNRRGYKQP